MAPGQTTFDTTPTSSARRVDGTLRLPVGWLASTEIETCGKGLPSGPAPKRSHNPQQVPTLVAATPAVPLGSVSGKNSSAPSHGLPQI